MTRGKQTKAAQTTQKKGVKYYLKAFALSAAIAAPMFFRSFSGSTGAMEETNPQVLADTETFDKDDIVNSVLEILNTEDLRGENGVDGVDGQDGQDGINGIDGIDGRDGRDGQDGQDGVSTTFDVKEVEGGYEITLTDVNHTETITIMNGKIETQYIEVEHKYTSEVTKKATCTASGVRTYSCDECDDTYTELIEATGHSYQATNSVVNADSTVTVTYACDNCGDSYSATVGTPVHRHSAARTVRENEVAATCTTADSYDSVVYCECGEELSRETITGTATGHNYVEDSATAVEPQPGVTGKQADKICQNCGDVIEGSVIDALHVHVIANEIVENEVAATCCEAGSYDKVSYCACGTEMNRETIVIEATGHNYVEDSATAVEPQVGIVGKKADKVCQNCGDVITGSEIAALVDYSSTRCEFNEFGWGFYTNLEGESICTTRGAYRDYLAANYPDATICEDEFAIWCE